MINDDGYGAAPIMEAPAMTPISRRTMNMATRP